MPIHHTYNTQDVEKFFRYNLPSSVRLPRRDTVQQHLTTIQDMLHRSPNPLNPIRMVFEAQDLPYQVSLPLYPSGFTQLDEGRARVIFYSQPYRQGWRIWIEYADDRIIFGRADQAVEIKPHGNMETVQLRDGLL